MGQQPYFYPQRACATLSQRSFFLRDNSILSFLNMQTNMQMNVQMNMQKLHTPLFGSCHFDIFGATQCKSFSDIGAFTLILFARCASDDTIL